MNLRRLSWLLLLCLPCGCSTTRLGTIKAAEPVVIVVMMGPHADGANVLRVRNAAVGDDAATGAKAGAWTGALVGLGSCGLAGPFVLFCVPVGVVMFGGVGGLAGAAAGVVESLPQEKATMLEARVVRHRQAHDVQDALRKAVVERAQRRWQLAPDASRVIHVELEDAMLRSTRQESIALVMRIQVSVRDRNAGRDDNSPRKRFEFVGPGANLASWLDEQGDFIETSVRIACEHLAAQVVAELAAN